jgi:ABC-type glycerol-3-phosphate transport system substrate-binding protein
MELFESLPDHLVALLLQRGIDLIDEDGRPHLTDPKVAATLTFYAQLVAGPRRIAVESNAGTGPYVNDLVAGNIAATLTPDWRLFYLRAYGGDALKGRLRMMPLPRFDPADPPTTTWSGTMAAIPRAAKHPAVAWKMIEFFYLGEASLEARVKESGILPPVKDYWDRPFLHEPDPLFAGGQRTMELYIDLAEQVPPRHLSWASPVAAAALGYVLNEANQYLRSGRPAEGLEPYVRGRLKWAEPFVRRYIEHGTLAGPGD